MRVVNFVVGVLVERFWIAAGDTQPPQPVIGVGESELLAVRRPQRRVEEPAGEMRQYFFRAALGRPHCDLLPARHVRGVGDRGTIRRPGRMVLIGIACRREIAGGAVFRRHGEDVAARAQHRALAVRRNIVIRVVCRIHIPDRVIRVHRARQPARAVIGDRERQLAQRLAGQIDHIQRATLLERDAGITERWEIDVVIGEMGHLVHGLGGEIVAPDIGAPVGVPVGEKIQLAAIPHWRRVGAFPIADLPQLAFGEIVGEYFLRQSAVVAFPGAEIAEDARVGDVVRIRPEAHQAAAVQRQRCGQPARDRHLEQPDVPARLRRPARQEHDVLGIRRPRHHQIVRPPAVRRLRHDIGMECQARRHAARGRHHIHILIALGARGVGDPFAVRRKARHPVLPRIAGQPRGGAAGAVHAPQIAVRHEHHAAAMQVRKPRQRLRGGRQRRQHQSREPGHCRTNSHTISLFHPRHADR